MIPTVHLLECPEPPAYMPDERTMVAYVVDGTEPAAWQTYDPPAVVWMLDHATDRLPSDGYRMF